MTYRSSIHLVIYPFTVSQFLLQMTILTLCIRFYYWTLEQCRRCDNLIIYFILLSHVKEGDLMMATIC